MMKFSIVTISFNQAPFLERALRSVLSQTGVNVEYIVVDPGSTDGSREIIERYRPQLDHVVFEKDNGPADGLNKGFALATGDWFGYINSDDFFLPGALNQAAKAISSAPSADCVYANGYIADVDGKPLRRVYSTPFSARSFVWGRSLVLQQSTFIKANSFREVGGFETENHTSWDAELLVDLSLAGMTLRPVPGFWSAFVVHPTSITGSQSHAALSVVNHERMFRKVVGRERTLLDLRLRRLNAYATHLMRPTRLLTRIADRLIPGRLPHSLIAP
ncbi:glycosyltransferase family 2 protein [Prosthecomicrobium hirschii]|uniref:glycosyltransferase family 2 protein n=1 Tax=Prosthecodimorpha hirschii TaxID=665126 RepID=UPI000B2DFDD1|nr:glycosyltransferase family 2 protein [Prosthecomicrobium hirschii]